jgi:hypothetical protein
MPVTDENAGSEDLPEGIAPSVGGVSIGRVLEEN